ncbi:RNA-binding cell elongation regulator Jag/EloR [Bacillus massilinigeriensis]|uniref:RNA-binding cell elongation regulator Jag/EloR n=1 Tax=Bacillus mediterraneensis TaxID=1805474 RepID=UPI0008F8B361|nr:RNA-binding cell elongation regulator Jag/EloR [Bacillus mediterraneensis]
MKQVTAKGQTVEEAVKIALSQLETTADRVETEVVDEGKKGLFGIFGSRPAIVNVKIKIDPFEEAVNYLKAIGEKLEAPIEVEVKQEGKHVHFIMSGEKIALLIGKRGQTLNSLQHLTQLVMNRHSDVFYTVLLDAEGYRERRNETLIQLAGRLAEKAVSTGKDVALEPMPSYERKVIHTALVANKKIKTFSDGNEPNRHIIISPIRK